ncbi:hypothetical protein CCGE531_16825 [Rhizobium sp. CCGE531]|nr:hypothetical protein CCGE531_16825 [Rhizobium sp. CCGE531]AYG73895.1 hypothetical protein CCGE532_16330 [Rhizobium sp. CCGE532]
MTLRLSPIERSCLRWALLGWSVSDIALLQGKSDREVRSCLTQAIARLGATSLKDALTKMTM